VGEWACATANRLELKVCDEFVGHELSGKELGDAIYFCAGNSHEEGQRVEDVPEYELDSELLDSEAQSDPGEEAIDRIDQCEDGQDVGAVKGVSVTEALTLRPEVTQFDQLQLSRRGHRGKRRGGGWTVCPVCQPYHDRRQHVHE